MGAPVDLVGDLLAQHRSFEENLGLVPPAPATLDTAKVIPKRCPKTKPSARRTLTESQQGKLAALPKKVADFVGRLMSKGLDLAILEAARAGKNGFSPTKHRAYHHAFDLMLEAGITQPYLRACYVKDLGWSPESAKAQASLTWKVFIALGIAKEYGVALVALPLWEREDVKVKYARN